MITHKSEPESRKLHRAGDTGTSRWRINPACETGDLQMRETGDLQMQRCRLF
jgi:hypothetical protein